MQHTQHDDLAESIQRRLRDEVGRQIVVAITGNTVLLSGPVENEEHRQRAATIAREMAPGLRVDNGLEARRMIAEDIEDTVGVNDDELDSPELNDINPADAPDELLVSDVGDEDLHEEPLETNELDVVDPTTYDEEDPVEPDPAYFAPTDPVIGSDDQGNTAIVGGWDPTSMSSQEIAPSAEDNQPGDEALADAIRQELREDATTTTLRIDVQVERGVARLRGRVPDLIDAENAESVAGRVPGVRDVIEDLDVASM